MQTGQPYAYANGNPVSYADPSGEYPDCGEGVDDYYLVNSYYFKKPEGGHDYADLFCGNSKFGFRHIKESDGGRRISNFPGEWPAFNYSIGSVERAWTGKTYDPKRDTWSLHEKLYLCNSAENWYKPFEFYVVDAPPRKDLPWRIITAWPDWEKQQTGPCPTGA